MDNRMTSMLHRSRLVVSLTISFWSVVALAGVASSWKAGHNFIGLFFVFVAILGVGSSLYGASFLATRWDHMSTPHRVLRLAALACALAAVAVVLVEAVA